MVRRPLIRAVRAAYRATDRSPAGRLLPQSLVNRVRERLLVMDADDVLTVLDALAANGVTATLAGGWGVDALLGENTRPHLDLDLTIPHDDEAVRLACEALVGLGYTVTNPSAKAGGWMPNRLVLRDPDGRAIDLLPVDGSTLPYDPEAAVATGTIDGRKVRCLSPALQLAVHDGFEPSDNHRADVALLCRRFDLEPPPAYRGS